LADDRVRDAHHATERRRLTSPLSMANDATVADHPLGVRVVVAPVETQVLRSPRAARRVQRNIVVIACAEHGVDAQTRSSNTKV